jgi:hypothetical protein
MHCGGVNRDQYGTGVESIGPSGDFLDPAERGVWWSA